MTFINLITEILIWGSERGEEERAETPHGVGFFLVKHMGLVKAIIDAGLKPGQNVAHVSTTSGSGTETPLFGVWRRVIWCQLPPADQLQIFINFCGQSISHWGEYSFNGTWSYFEGAKC